MQLDFAAGALFRRVHHASIERSRINVQAERALVEFFRIDDPMYRIGWVHRTGMGEVYLQGVERVQLAAPARQILMNKVEVFFLQPAEWDRHPAVLVAMVVNRTGLTYFPADGHQF